MPIYEYRCLSCDHEFELLVMKKDEDIYCDSCASSQLQKLISTHSIGKGAPDTPCGSAPCSPRPRCGSGLCGG